MNTSMSPLVFWDYCMERRTRINNLTAKNLFQLEGRNPHYSVTGQEGDISNICMFDWYDWCYFHEQGSKFPFTKEVLGRVLGPATGEGNEMSQWILKANGRVVPRRTVRPLRIDEKNCPNEQKKRNLFDELISTRWGTSLHPPEKPLNDSFEEYEDDDEIPRIIPEATDPVDATGRPLNMQPEYDQLINLEINMHQGDVLRQAKVVGRTVTADGITPGTYNSNPILNSLTYDVEFPDGEVREYAANIIAQNMLSQVDSEGFTITHLKDIIDWRKNDLAVKNSELYCTTKRGRKRMRHTTCGWKILVRWTDSTETWVPLKDMKESHPVEMAEFAKSRGIQDEPAFIWWVPYTLRKRDVIIGSVKARFRRLTHKYGVELPRNIQHARELDTANKNTYWMDALQKEMRNIGLGLEILENDAHLPVGFKLATGHLIWDIKIDMLRKARWVLDGHKNPDPLHSTYAGVVSRESVRIALTYAALNDIDVKAADIRNAYLQAPTSEKYYVVCGAEFGLENVGKRALIRRALYGGKSAGRDFRNHLRACMEHIEFKACPADPDIWMRPARKSDGSEYWEYVLLYTDDILVVSEYGEKLLRKQIGKYFELKEESIGSPEFYLGGKLRKATLDNGIKAWAFGSSKYVQASVNNVVEHLA